MSALGLTVSQVENALYSAYGTRQVSQIYAPNNQYQVIMQLAPGVSERSGEALDALRALVERQSDSARTRVATVTTDVGPSVVSHTGQLPSVTLSFNLKPGYALGDAVDAIRATAAATLPSTISTAFQGTAQAFQDSLQGLGLVLAMAIVVIYIVLGILYESFTHPLTILSGLPAAGFGALLTLLIFKTELSLYAFVGIIMLVGLVKKNGIMMVDFAVEAQRERGLSPRDAIHEACLVRFRPIMMTTMAALFGTLPIALGCRCRRRVPAAARPGGRGRPARLAAADALHHAGVLRLHRGPAAAPDVAAAGARRGPGAARRRAPDVASYVARALELTGQAVEQGGLSRQRVGDSPDLTIDLTVPLVFDRLANARHRLHAVAGVVAGGVQQVAVPRPPWQAVAVDELAFALHEPCVHALHPRLIRDQLRPRAVTQRLLVAVGRLRQRRRGVLERREVHRRRHRLDGSESAAAASDR